MIYYIIKYGSLFISIMIITAGFSLLLEDDLEAEIYKEEHPDFIGIYITKRRIKAGLITLAASIPFIFFGLFL